MRFLRNIQHLLVYTKSFRYKFKANENNFYNAHDRLSRQIIVIENSSTIQCRKENT